MTLDEKKSNSSTSARPISVNQEDPEHFVGKIISNKEAENNDDHDENADDFSVNISNATTKWTTDQKLNTLENINLSVKPGQLVAIIGPVGAGKVKIKIVYIFFHGSMAVFSVIFRKGFLNSLSG